MAQVDYTALLALVPLNTTGDISPQDLRSVIETLTGSYGGLRVDVAAASQTIGTTYTKITAWDDLLPNDGTVVVGNLTDDDIDVLLAGDYLLTCSLSFSGTGNSEVEASIFVNGSTVGKIWHRKIGSGGDVGSASGEIIISLPATCVVELRLLMDGVSDDVTVVAGNLTVTRLR